MAARLEAADPIVGNGWEFDAIAATILGGTSFEKGQRDAWAGRCWGCCSSPCPAQRPQRDRRGSDVAAGAHRPGHHRAIVFDVLLKQRGVIQ